MAVNDSKYSPDEILQILNDYYNFQSVFDPEVSPGQALTFGTEIWEWMDICDLIEHKALAKYYHSLFRLTTPVHELEQILSHQEATLKGFTLYIADHAVKQTVAPIVTMGQSCMTAAIFKTLTGNLKTRGIETQSIKPSSKIAPLFRKHGPAFIEEVNKLAPGSLSIFHYEENWISKAGSSFFLFFLLAIIIVPIVWHFHWLLLVPLFVGIALMVVGNKFSPAKEVIGGYDTIRDLIVGMQARM
jgi:hypothetical protein